MMDDWFLFKFMLDLAREWDEETLQERAETLGAPEPTPEAIAFQSVFECREEEAAKNAGIDLFVRKRDPRISLAARYLALKGAEAKCCLCGAGPKDGALLRADHIKPVSRYSKLRDDPNNLQILCDECNSGKGDRDETDWR